MTDLTHGYGKHRNYICLNKTYDFLGPCHGHHWKGKWYTKEEWEEFVNDDR